MASANVPPTLNSSGIRLEPACLSSGPTGHAASYLGFSPLSYISVEYWGCSASEGRLILRKIILSLHSFANAHPSLCHHWLFQWWHREGNKCLYNEIIQTIQERNFPLSTILVLTMYVMTRLIGDGELQQKLVPRSCNFCYFSYISKYYNRTSQPNLHKFNVRSTSANSSIC